jgi:hypothetical protein
MALFWLQNRLQRFLICDGFDNEKLICNEKSFDKGINSFAFMVIVTFIA